ncbi:MAG: hypothetical protein KBS70_05725 [Bacteroidales bacterium]|nr:hypothetical protein [Candidatus Colicola equi]
MMILNLIYYRLSVAGNTTVKSCIMSAADISIKKWGLKTEMPKRADYIVTDITNMGLKELAEYRRKLAKRANQRLVRLEQAGINPKASAAENYAYRYLRRTHRNRFTENKKAQNINRERADIANLERFLNAQTSTVSGVKKVRAKVVKTFQKKGINLTEKQIDALLTKGFSILKMSLGSDFAVSAMKAISDNNISVDTFLKRLADITIEEDETIDDVFAKLGLKFKPETVKKVDNSVNPFR